MTELYLGIDLGTSNSCCYCYDGNEYKCIETEGNDHLVPSYILWNGATVMVGRAAKLQSGTRGSTFVRNSKRVIGRKFNDSAVQEMLHRCGSDIVNVNGNPAFQVTNSMRVTPAECGSEIIKYFIQRVREKYENCEIKRVCVTIPAHFDQNQRVETIRAAEDAGLNKRDIIIINEPSAAAICYGIGNAIQDQTFLVYDLGGGTFDVTIMTIKGNNFNVIRHDGDNQLGGDTFDAMIAKWIVQKVNTIFHVNILPQDRDSTAFKRVWKKLLSMAEEAKIGLGTKKMMEVSLVDFRRSFPQDDDDEEEDKIVLITRQDMNNIISTKIDESLRIVDRCITGAGLSRNSIERVVLVGGSSRLCLVKDKLEGMFGMAKTTKSVNPDECVAEGACHHCVESLHQYVPTNEGSSLKATERHVHLDERTAYSLGSLVVGNIVSVLIEKNTIIPTSRTKRYSTSADNTTSISDAVFQGESTNPDECVKLAPFTVSGITPRPRGVPSLMYTYTIKEDGLLYVTVVEGETNRVLLPEMVVEFDRY